VTNTGPLGVGFFISERRDTMKNLVVCTTVLLAFFLFSCSSVKVITDFDPEYDFSTFKTYRWADANEINPDDELAKAPLVYRRVQAAVDRELADKGFKLVDSEKCDFVVIAHAGVKEKTRIHHTGGFYGGWYDPFWGAYGGTTHVSHYEEGTLVLDIVYWETKELAWRGMGTSVLRNMDEPEKVTKNVNNWVKEILKDFPPVK